MLSVRELRKITGLSQDKFANKYHIKASTLRDWEQGKHSVPESVLYLLNEVIKYEGYLYENSN